MSDVELKYFERIESYFDKEMSEQERILFEKELGTNEDLKQEFAVYTAIVEEVKQKKRSELKAKLEQADKELDNPFQIKPVSGQRFWRYSLAACITLMISLSIGYLYLNRISNKLVAAYWQRDTGLPVMMNGDSNAPFDNAMTAFKSGDYAYAFAQFEHLQQTDTILYYEGLCSFELKGDAANYMKPVAENRNSIFQAKAKYYMILLYISAEKKEEARKLLSELRMDTEHPYKEQIEKLSKETYFTSE
jgi:hypothetical protein